MSTTLPGARKLRVKFFASLREALGAGYADVHTEATTVGQLRAELMARDALHAECLRPDRAVRCAVNQVMGDESTALTDGAEVAFFPPVTGG